MLEQVTREVQNELRRRLGSTFTTDELTELYDAGTSWVSDIAVAVAPESPHGVKQADEVDARAGMVGRERQPQGKSFHHNLRSGP